MTDLTNLISRPGGHKDSRREIIDVTPRVKKFTVADMTGLELGHHYHARTNELFHVLEGQMRIKFEDINTKQRMEYVVTPGQNVTVPLYVAHLVLPTPNAVFLGEVHPEFDREDLNPYKITW